MGTPAPATVEKEGGKEEGEKGPPAPYDYEYLTDEAVRAWSETGRQAVLDSGREGDGLTVSAILQETVRSALDGRLDAAEAGPVVRQLTAQHPEGGGLDVQSLFLNTISLLDDADTKNPALLPLLAATGIDPEVIRQELDVPLLTTLSLVRTSFNQMRARKTTNLLYRQSNFNLLREETEGYSKLLTEYFNIAEDSTKSTNPYVAEDAFRRIMALVGAFDLDVGRVLDITLDISANSLVKAYQFLIKFYRCSSWWPDGGNLDNVKWEDDGFNTFPAWALPGSGRLAPKEGEVSEIVETKPLRDEHFWAQVKEKGMDAFFGLGQRRIVDFDSVVDLLSTEVPAEVDTKGKELMEDRRKRLTENRKYMLETKTLPPSGNSDAAQILGFKLRYYASPARDADDKLPDNLIHFTALLIKTGFISLRDLYPHLYPPDEKMPEERTRLEREKAELEAKQRPGGGLNKLAMAAALTDDTLPVARRNEKDRSGAGTPKPGEKKDETAGQDELPAPANQKLLLLKTLLAHGAIPEALYIVGRFPWLVDVDTSLPPYLIRIVKHMLSKMTDSVRPLADRPGLADPRKQLEDTTPGLDGTMPFKPVQARRPTKWLGLEEVQEKDGSRFRYYYTEWADNLPVCQTLDDVSDLCNTFLGLLGPKIGLDPIIHSTLLRLCKQSLDSDFSKPNQTRWLDIIRRLLLPALSIGKHNPSLTSETYAILTLFPTSTRFALYAEWFTGRTSRLPDVASAFARNRAEVKDVLRRVSNENTKSMSRALGKVSYASPGILMMYMINQLESYSNMIPALVDCTKYFPKLAYDVLTWCLINSLGGQGRDRMQADGMLTSSWLQALSQFVASLFARYSTVNPAPILQYLANELRKGDSTDLEMFEQILTEMAGIRADVAEFNESQLQAMAGGEHLQAHILQQLSDTRHAKKAQAKRLIRALSDSGLAGQMLVAIAQERKVYAHRDGAKFMPLKVLGNNLDKVGMVFAQYLEVLRFNLRPQEFEAAVPDVVALVGDYGLEPSVAFAICRGVIMQRLIEVDDALKAEEDELKKQRKERRSQSAAGGDVEMVEAAAKSEGDEGNEAKAVGSEEAAVVDDGIKPAPTPQTSPKSPWHPILEALTERLRAVTGDLHTRISLPFYTTFWTYTFSDLAVPMANYTTETDKLKLESKDLLRRISTASTSTKSELDRKHARNQELLSRLAFEGKTRIAHYQKIGHRLNNKEKEHWFSPAKTGEQLRRQHESLLQECFLPRAMMGPADAQYAFIMLKKLHAVGTPGFSTLVTIDILLRKQALAATIFQCTGQEAASFGRFLNEVLKMLAGWHAKKEDYDVQAMGKGKLPGFVKGPVDFDKDASSWNHMDYETFRRQLFNWHSSIEGALASCLSGGEYMHIRNGIVVLKQIVGVYPQLMHHGKKLLECVEKLGREEERQDLKIMALSVAAPLKSREKVWVSPQAFRLNEAGKGGTPTPAGKKLDAAAPEFKPATDGQARKESVAGPEDGEVQEEGKKERDDVMKDAGPVKQEEIKNQDTPSAPASKPTPEMKTELAAAAASKPSTPAPATPSGPRQPAINGNARRDAPVHSSAPLPPQAAPPPRPESRSHHADKPLPPQPVARPDARYPRRGDDGYGRLDRPGDVRPPSRDHSPGGRPSRARTPPDMARSYARDERPPRSTREEWPSRRDAPPGAMHGRASDVRDRPNGNMGPPTAQGFAPPRPGQLNSTASAPSVPQVQAPPRPASSAPPTPSEGPDSAQFRVNSERQRMIEEAQKRSGPPSEPRRERDERDSRTTGRPEPPRDQQNRPPTDLAPTALRKGRLSRDLTREESTYGRLNQPPMPEPQGPPSGPSAGGRGMTGPAARGGRNFTAPAVQQNGRQNEQPVSSPSSRGPPESPASFRPQQPPRHFLNERNDRRDQPPRQMNAPSSTPATPTEEMAGMNPDRLRLITGGNQAQSLGNASSPSSAAPPSGPRVAHGRAPPVNAPIESLPSTAAPPTGPASAQDRQQRGQRPRGAVNAVNAILTAGNNAPSPRGNGQDVSFRGASSRQNSFGVPSGGPAPPPPAEALSMEPMQRRNEAPQRFDGPPSRPDSRAMQSRGDLLQHPDRLNDGRARREDDRQPRTSRHPSRERRPDDEPPRRPPPPGMEDKRGPPPRDERRPRDEREAREHRRYEESRRPPPDMPGPMNGMPPQQDYLRGYGGGDPSRRDGPRGGTRPEDYPRGGRREGERRDQGVRGPPSMRDDGPPKREEGLPPDRKRRPEDVPFDPTKRSRRSGAGGR